MIYTNVSFVGSTALANGVGALWQRYANGVIVTQVVPAVNSYASAILNTSRRWPNIFRAKRAITFRSRATLTQAS